MQGQEFNHDTTKNIDKVMSKLYIRTMPDGFEIRDQMKTRLIHECKNIAAGRERIARDIEAYLRVVDEREQIAKREKRAMSIIASLGLEQFAKFYKDDAEFGPVMASAMTVSPQEIRDNFSLWEAMREYLHYVSEARISEMENFFQIVQMPNANRQAMESALKRHPETFRIRKANREKYISLKNRAKEGV